MQTGDIREDDRSAPFPERLGTVLSGVQTEILYLRLGSSPALSQNLLYKHMESDRARPDPVLPGVTVEVSGATYSVIHSNENGDPMGRRSSQHEQAVSW
jgi:hypothetical protein